MRPTWITAIGLIVVAIVAGLTPSLSASAREWPEGGPPEGANISVNVAGAPDIRAAATVEVRRDATDITDDACAVNPAPEDAVRSLVCFDLPDGTYSVTVTPADPAHEVRIVCTDITASQTEPSSIQLGDGFTDWDCRAWVGPPTINLVGNATDPFEPVLLDADGTPVECIVERSTSTTDRLPDRIHHWCAAPPGTYRVDVDSVDPDYVEGWNCSELGTFTPVSGFLDPFVELVVTDDSPFVGCDQQGPADALLETRIEFVEGRDRSWADGIGFTAVDGEGNSFRDTCQVGRFRDDELARVTENFCRAPIGIVDFGLTGVPDGATVTGQGVVDRDCEPLEHGVSVQAICIVMISFPEAPLLPIDPVDELPSTGAATVLLVVLGTTLTAVGVALLAATRTRPPRVRTFPSR